MGGNTRPTTATELLGDSQNSENHIHSVISDDLWGDFVMSGQASTMMSMCYSCVGSSFLAGDAEQGLAVEYCR